MKKQKLTKGLMSFALIACGMTMAHADPEWRITALTPKYILVQADSSKDENKAFFADERHETETKNKRDWQIARIYVAIQQDVEAKVRKPVADSMSTIPGFCSYWPEANGVKRFTKEDGTCFSIKSADIIHNAFIKVPTMKDGTVVDLGVAGKFKYSSSEPTPVFKVNQVGYAPKARKYAYAGRWLGLTGPLPLKQFENKPFNVIDVKTGKTAYTGKLTMRRDDPTKNGTPFVGEEVLEIDLTPLSNVGEYYIEVAGIGRSYNFSISDNAIVEAWGNHMLGIFNKRCGIEKKAPWTQWPSEACHLNVYRGVNVSDQWHYDHFITLPDGTRPLTKEGKEHKFKHFPTIDASKELCDLTSPIHIPGGYHDAADYDRRPMHLVIPRALAIVYLLHPENFFDGQLCIPESGNGIPDILDEAYWGIKHLYAAQQEDGGVGTWIETTGHPGGEKDSPMVDSEKRYYFLARPTHNSCYNYAGTAALVARAFKAAGNDKIANELLKSAKRAWEWGQRNPPVQQKLKGYASNKWTKENAVDVIYKEPEDYSAKQILTAALNLSTLTGDTSYFNEVVARMSSLKTETNKGSWGWNPFDLLEFALKDQPMVPEVEVYRADYIKRRVREADTMLDALENAYPYRIPWFPAEHGFVNTMSWGNSHPLRRVQTLIAAHAFTGDDKYLEGVYLANDFHNGANPDGECLTSGMGKVFPVKFLDLQSVSDNISEYVGGITPYRWNFGINQEAKNFVYGVDNVSKWPFWRRFANIEQYTVAASEYTVWETMLPPAAALAYILPGPQKVPEKVYSRKPSDDISKLPGYWPMP